jgi:periplasmic copper chaperone A
MRTNPRYTQGRSIHPHRRWRTRAAVAVSGATALLLAAAGGAAAHITVHSTDAKPGGSGTLIFKVPNEEANASTTKVEIDLPTDTPLSDVTATAPSGWRADVTSASVVFSGGQITGDNDQEFPVRVGRLPSSGKVVFKALQTYSDGNVVRWVEQSASGTPQPAHPAPTLDLSNPNQVDNNADHDQYSASSTSSGSGSSSSRSATDTMGIMTAATATPAATSSSSPNASSSYSSNSSSSSSPSSVRAGTGGQAASDHGIPVAPLPFVLAGLAAAAYGARRLIRH